MSVILLARNPGEGFEMQRLEGNSWMEVREKWRQKYSIKWKAGYK